MRLRRVVSLVAIAPALFAQAEWKARVYGFDVAGRDIYGSDEHSSRVRIEGDAIQIRGKKTAPFDIPLSSIRSVQYDRTGRNMAVMILESVGTSAEAHGCSYDCVVALMISPAFAPFRHNHHFVNVGWTRGGTFQQATFRMSGSGAHSFARAVADATGRPWVDRPAERRRAKHEKKSASGSARTNAGPPGP